MMLSFSGKGPVIYDVHLHVEPSAVPVGDRLVCCFGAQVHEAVPGHQLMAQPILGNKTELCVEWGTGFCCQ